MNAVFEYLASLLARLGSWSYVVIFFGALLESAAFVGLVMPGESLVLLTGFLASHGVLDLDALIVTVAAGAVAGDAVGYSLGRRLGRGWLERRGGKTAERLHRVEAFFARHGGKAVFVGRFVGFARPLVPFIAGTAGMSRRWFTLYNVLGAAGWASSTVLLGYALGAAWQRAEQWIGRAGGLLGAVLALILVILWLRRWIIGHERQLRARWQHFLERPTVLRLRQRFEPQIHFLQRRLTPGGYLGLHLTVGMTVIVLAAWVFGAIAEDVLTGDPLVYVDERVAQWFHEHSTAAVDRVVDAIAFFGSPLFVTGASALCAAVLVARRRWYRLLALVLTMMGGSVLNLLLKAAFARARPWPLHDRALFPWSDYSFPSGHVMGSTLFYLFLAWLVVRATTAWQSRVTAILAAVTLILTIAFARIYAGVHYLSDTLGATAAGLAWLAFSLTAVETLRRYRIHDGSGK